MIDGHSLAFRAFYALPVDSFSTRDGQHTNAIHGFLSMLLLLLANEKPTHLAVAFDMSRQSFRTREYAEYKGNRGETPVEFKGQVPLLQDALQAMGIRTIEKEDFEADDILATLAARGVDEGYRVLLVSGDRDTIQLVNDDVTLLYPNTQGVSQLKRYDTAAVIERYGIRPEQYPDVAALVGEASDNLPGITKVGEKTAVKWLGLYGDLEGVLAHADEIKGVAGQNLRDQRENAERNRRLNRLVRDVPLDVVLAELAAKPVDVESVRPLFERLEFRTLLERLTKLAAGEANGNGGAAPAAAPIEPVAAEVVPAPDAPVSRALVGDELASWLERAAAAEPAGLGLSLDVLDGQVIGAGIATADESVRVPWQAGRAEFAPFEAWLASDAPKIITDAKGQLKALTRSGLAFAGLVLDPLVAGWLVRPALQEKSLADLVSFHLGEKVPQGDPSLLVPEEGSDAGAPEYAWYSLRLAPVVLRALSESSRRLLAEVEMPLVPVLAAMELRGVTVDHAELSALSSELGDQAAGLAQLAYAEIGREVNLGSPKQLQEVLFDQLGMPKTRSTKTGYTTDASALADLQESNPHPFLGYLLEHRDATKLRQIVESLDKAIGSDGRIHTTLRADRRRDRPHVVERPEPAEHPDPHVRGSSHPQGLPARSRVRRAADRRLFADRDAHHGAPLRRPGAHRGVQRRRRPAPIRGRARLRRRPGRCHAAHAHEGQGDVVRTRVRPQRIRTVEAAAHRACRGAAAHARVLRAFRRRSRLPARRRRAGEGRRLHRDDLRSPSSVPRPEQPQSGASRERRTRRVELADPGLGRRCHEDRHGRRRSPRSPRRGSAAECCSPCTTS